MSKVEFLQKTLELAKAEERLAEAKDSADPAELALIKAYVRELRQEYRENWRGRYAMPGDAAANPAPVEVKVGLKDVILRGKTS